MMRTRRGFTLVELLVVIAIIALLAALLLPALKNAREQGRTARCLSNVRQFGLAAQMYLNDANGYVPPAYANGISFFRVNGSLGQYLYPNATVDSTHPCPLRCPSFLSAFTPPDGPPMVNLNVDVCFYSNWGGNSAPYQQVSRWSAPTEVVLMRDMEFANLEWATIQATGYYVIYPGYLANYYSYRHNGNFNVLFMDGHAVWLHTLANTPQSWGVN